MKHFQPDDHLRHAPDESGRMRDSLFWQTVLGEERLGFQAYLYLTAKGKAGFNVILWGEEKPLAFGRSEGEIPAAMNLDDFRMEGLSLRQPGFGEPSRIAYESAKISFDLTFAGRHDPFSYLANPDGLPQWFARNRYEQGGRLTGFVEAKGRRFDIDQPGHHDHSWGNRNWGMPQHWKWFCAYTPDGSVTLNGWIWIARGEMGCAGFVHRDGRTIAIVTIRQQAQYDEEMGQTRLDATLIDIEGGETELVLERFALVRLPTGDKIGTIIQEAACTASIDGTPGLGQFETHWHQAYIDHLCETRSTR